MDFCSKTLVGLVFFIITTMICSGSAYAIDPETIVGMWLLNEGQGDKVNDSSDNSNDGDIFGAIWSDGKFGKALNFDGVDDYVEIPDDPSLEGMDELTIATWVFLHSHTADNYNGFLDKTAGATDRSYNLAQRSGQWECGVVNDANAKVQLSGGATKDGEWVHLAGTYDGSEIKLYENAVEVGVLAQNGKVSESNTSLQFGRWPGNGGIYHAECILDEIVILRVALEQDDIESIMTQGLEKALAVDSIGKLATKWAFVKTNHN